MRKLLFIGTLVQFLENAPTRLADMVIRPITR